VTVKIGEVVGFFAAFIAEPKDVEVGFVGIAEFLAVYLVDLHQC
jgi:hypothetical protein